ncbi:prephenate dehydrogenase [bacterium]|nr:MAG: prephenate dehydrogenase [bacterium]
MKLFNKVGIVGVGLIGGSIALALKKHKLCQTIIGVSRSRKTLLSAKARKAIDRGSQDIKLLREADLLILATPITVTLKLSPLISKIIKKGCIVTDVASTKEQVVSKLDSIFGNYIGTHPLAGSEKRGIAFAGADIFENSICILTPTGNTNPQTIARIKQLWLRLGAEIVVLPADMHDRILALLSHLPHAVAFSLMNSIPRSCLKLAPPSLKDTTRITASDSRIWSDIFLSNKRNIIRSIGIYQSELQHLKKTLQKGDRRLLIRLLEEAKKKREALG